MRGLVASALTMVTWLEHPHLTLLLLTPELPTPWSFGSCSSSFFEYLFYNSETHQNTPSHGVVRYLPVTATG
jgi:hypothetical protein